MMSITALIITMTSMTFLQTSHPLAMGLVLLIQTMMVCLMTGMMSKTFWFSYILFLIFLGGMLVLFIYVTALASNEMFSMSINKLYTMTMIMLMVMTITSMYDMYSLHNMTENAETIITEMNYKIMNQENSINLIKLYNYPTNYSTIMLMSYLLITLIAVVKVTNMFQGPLRKMN